MLEQWTAQIFQTCGVSSGTCNRGCCDSSCAAKLRDYKTHGMTRLASYVERLQAGDFNARPNMQHRTFPGGIVLEADGAMGQVAGPHAVRLGIEALAASAASVFIAVRSCGHLGALGIHALLGAEAGAFCMMGQRTPPLSRCRVFARAAIGHNPIAFGCPVPGSDPIIFRCRMQRGGARTHSARSRGKASLFPRAGLWTSWGRQRRIALRALKGALLPMGGHKGIGIAMMVECLAGALTATAESLRRKRTPSWKVARSDVREGVPMDAEADIFAALNTLRIHVSVDRDPTSLRVAREARLPGKRGSALEREPAREGSRCPAQLRRN